jgi:hypothetical protein
MRSPDIAVKLTQLRTRYSASVQPSRRRRNQSGHELLGRGDDLPVSVRGAGDDREALLRRQLAQLEHLAGAAWVHGDGLFREDVLAGPDGGLEVHGAEDRRGGQQHDVHAAVNELLVAVEGDEAAALWDIVARFLQAVASAGDSVLVRIGERGDADVHVEVLARVDAVPCGAAAASATADEARGDLLACAARGRAEDGEAGRGCAGGDGASSHEIAPRHPVCSVHPRSPKRPHEEES